MSRVGAFLEESGLKQEFQDQSAEFMKKGMKIVFKTIGDAVDASANPKPAQEAKRTPRRVVADEEEDDPYAVLGVRRSATDEVVQAAYRALSKTAHPDNGGSDEAQRELNLAYEQIMKERGGS